MFGWFRIIYISIYAPSYLEELRLSNTGIQSTFPSPQPRGSLLGIINTMNMTIPLLKHFSIDGLFGLKPMAGGLLCYAAILCHWILTRFNKYLGILGSCPMAASLLGVWTSHHAMFHSAWGCLRCSPWDALNMTAPYGPWQPTEPKEKQMAGRASEGRRAVRCLVSLLGYKATTVGTSSLAVLQYASCGIVNGWVL